MRTIQSSIDILTQICQKLLNDCQVKASDGTILYTPDGAPGDQHFYNALWTRDFAYMVENAYDLIPPERIDACIEYIVKARRNDSVIPDHVLANGKAIYAAGEEVKPLGEYNLDNAPFLVNMVFARLQDTTDPEKKKKLYLSWMKEVMLGMRQVIRSSYGLVYNDPATPHSPYGFTDTVCKTGLLLFESLLYWVAIQKLAVMCMEIGMAPEAARDLEQKRVIEENIFRLWDEEQGAFFAATRDCKQIDVWGNAFAIYLDFPLGEKRDRVLRFLVDHYDDYVYQGQVRHLLKGEYWQKLLMDVAPETYQNGAYWATASGWVLYALKQAGSDKFDPMLNDLMHSFETEGVYECVNQGYQKLKGYVVSATNPLGALKRIAEEG